MKYTTASSRLTRAVTAIVTAFGILAPFTASRVQADEDANSGSSGGAVYISVNSTSGNQILAYSRDKQGHLQGAGQFATGGTGLAGGLGNQGGLAMSRDGNFLLVVNAGSSDISSLAIGRSGLRLADRQPSGGVRPLSIAVSDDLVYVVNAGGASGSSDNIAGFRLNRWGRLQEIPNSSHPLSAANSGPAQISFNPEGDVLLVTEKMTHTLTTFRLGPDGRVLSQQSTPSSGDTPFGFNFAGRAKVFVANASGSVSSYFIDETATPVVLANAVSANATAVCWLVANKSATFAYVANTGPSTLSLMRLGNGGSVQLVENVTAGNLQGPADEALSADDRYLYVRNGGNQSLSIYTVNADGSLTAQPSLFGLPAGANGVVAR